MWEIILKSLNIVLVVYALVTLVTRLFFWGTKKEYYKEDYFVILNIKNSQEHIEGIIRSIIWRSLSVSGGGLVPNILIVDKGTTEETLKIINNLMNEYGFIYYVTEENFEKMKKSFVK